MRGTLRLSRVNHLCEHRIWLVIKSRSRRDVDAHSDNPADHHVSSEASDASPRNVRRDGHLLRRVSSEREGRDELLLSVDRKRAGGRLAGQPVGCLHMRSRRLRIERHIFSCATRHSSARAKAKRQRD